MDGLPVTIRLLDAPLHEFLPPVEDLAVAVAVAESTGTNAPRDAEKLAAVRRAQERNPMLGMRGVRLGLAIPGLFAMQVRAIAQAVLEARGAGVDARPEILVPLVGAAREIEVVRRDTTKILTELLGEATIPVGTMIEVPRAAVTAEAIARHTEFFSFGTNDLTQMCWGLSRDDAEHSFFDDYRRLGVFDVSPFESLDVEGIGYLIRIAVEAGRRTRPDLKIGICGEHGGDPDSIHFCDELGLDYVSCSPFRVPIARLEAGRAAVINLSAAGAPTSASRSSPGEH
jgi:pyruvate,orthophosphate dikinase